MLPRVVHAKILDFMAFLVQTGAQFNDIGFRTAPGLQEFIDYQDFHHVLRFAALIPVDIHHNQFRGIF